MKATRSAIRKVATAIGIVLLGTASLLAESRRIAFLAAEPSLEQIGPHNRAAWETAATLGEVTLLLRQANGSFADSSDNTRRLSEFDVIWYHQGDAIRRTAVYQGESLGEIRRFAQSGRGVLLSGGALAMVAQLGLETEIRPQRHDLGNYREPAAMVPIEMTHPAFSGLRWAIDTERRDDHVVWLSRGGCHAVADFYWGGPAEGMVLAETPTGRENPLVEYTLGKGRVIVFGWHWPDYADKESPHRDNLVRLTSNLLNYLADVQIWRDVVVRSEYPPMASPDDPGISPGRWRALRMAVEDLSASFPDRYQEGDKFVKRLETLRAEHDCLSRNVASTEYAAIAKQFEALKQEALLANPLLDFDRLLMIRRRGDNLGLPVNFNGNADIGPTGYDNTLVVLSPVRPEGKLETIFKP